MEEDPIGQVLKYLLAGRLENAFRAARSIATPPDWKQEFQSVDWTPLLRILEHSPSKASMLVNALAHERSVVRKMAGALLPHTKTSCLEELLDFIVDGLEPGLRGKGLGPSYGGFTSYLGFQINRIPKRDGQEKEPGSSSVRTRFVRESIRTGAQALESVAPQWIVVLFELTSLLDLIVTAAADRKDRSSGFYPGDPLPYAMFESWIGDGRPFLRRRVAMLFSKHPKWAESVFDEWFADRSVLQSNAFDWTGDPRARKWILGIPGTRQKQWGVTGDWLARFSRQYAVDFMRSSEQLREAIRDAYLKRVRSIKVEEIEMPAAYSFLVEAMESGELRLTREELNRILPEKEPTDKKAAESFGRLLELTGAPVQDKSPRIWIRRYLELLEQPSNFFREALEEAQLARDTPWWSTHRDRVRTSVGPLLYGRFASVMTDCRTLAQGSGSERELGLPYSVESFWPWDLARFNLLESIVFLAEPEVLGQAIDYFRSAFQPLPNSRYLAHAASVLQAFASVNELWQRPLAFDFLDTVRNTTDIEKENPEHLTAVLLADCEYVRDIALSLLERSFDELTFLPPEVAEYLLANGQEAMVFSAALTGKMDPPARSFSDISTAQKWQSKMAEVVATGFRRDFGELLTAFENRATGEFDAILLERMLSDAEFVETHSDRIQALLSHPDPAIVQVALRCLARNVGLVVSDADEIIEQLREHVIEGTAGVVAEAAHLAGGLGSLSKDLVGPCMILLRAAFDREEEQTVKSVLEAMSWILERFPGSFSLDEDFQSKLTGWVDRKPEVFSRFLDLAQLDET